MEWKEALQEETAVASWSYEAVCHLAENPMVQTEDLMMGADAVRRQFKGTQTSLCTIVNGRSGKCSEDCKFCAQSKYYPTDVTTYGMMPTEDILKAAKTAEESGVHCFSIVTSGGYLSDSLLEALEPVYRRLKAETQLSLCASHGMLTALQAQRLKAVGVTTYHHNLETSRKFYPTICTTHAYDERIETVKVCQSAGLNVCCGGIMGLGETMADRISLAFEIKALGIQSVPMNILMPIEGTPMAMNAPLSTDEILRTLAMFRLILPEADIRIAGGRAKLGRHVENALTGGVNALMVGNYLTTIGSVVEADLKMMAALGYQL
ncbi:biotin synthase BioB [Fusibacter paucivorans]|uniref:Biotin synthase n=1 Tax=Fusibacter paucivorans TaxID=76009 RepID=A0ABS5PPC0_9FIRM|nr:biotin synthase BioB [Fusibacter paucivorans]MBS7527018.1 biotin synthase BioB [Fusibacter paucivorans]